MQSDRPAEDLVDLLPGEVDELLVERIIDTGASVAGDREALDAMETSASSASSTAFHHRAASPG
jgi:hypothetical protein